MKIVRDRAEARWLPSRYRFATFRLLAWLVYRNMASEPQPGLVLALDRDQSALESYSVAVFVVTVTTCFFLSPLQDVFAWPLAIVVAFCAAVIALQMVVASIGAAVPGLRWRNNVDLVSFVIFFLLTVAAVYFVATAAWIRLVAWTFLALLAINGIAAAVVRLFRERLPD